MNVASKYREVGKEERSEKWYKVGGIEYGR